MRARSRRDVTGRSPRDRVSWFASVGHAQRLQRELDGLRGRHTQRIAPQGQCRSLQKMAPDRIRIRDAAGQIIQNRQQCAFRKIAVCPLAPRLLESVPPKAWACQRSAPPQAFGPIAWQALFSWATRETGKKEPHALLR